MRSLFVVATLTLLLPASASATVMVEVPLEDMARDADAIVVGRVLRSEVQLRVDPVRGVEPHTLTTLAVGEWIVGPGGATVVIDELGGEVQGRGLAVAGVPVYHRGEEVVVFLERAPTGLRTYAMAQCRFEIRRGIGGVPDHVFRDLSEVAFASWSGGRMRVGEGSEVPVSLGIFLEYVRRIASYGAASGPRAGRVAR